MTMRRRFIIAGVLLAAATLGLAFAGWIAGPGEWRALLGCLAFAPGVGLLVVWLATATLFDLSGRDEWILACLIVSALALAFAVFTLGPTPAALLWGLAAGPACATLYMIRRMLRGWWPDEKNRSRRLRDRARRRTRAAERPAHAAVPGTIRRADKGNPPMTRDEIEGRS